MQTETWYALATLGAILLGPIFAVIVTRKIDQSRDARQRKLDVFRNLMQTRGIRLDPVHVAALNIVEIEFYKEPKVRTAFKEYVAHLGAPMPSVEEQDRFFAQRTDLFVEFLATIGQALNLQFDKRDLERLTYVPEGWNTDQNLQRKNAFLLSQILGGERAIPVTSMISGPSPYPDAPKLEKPRDE